MKNENKVGVKRRLFLIDLYVFKKFYFYSLVLTGLVYLETSIGLLLLSEGISFFFYTLLKEFSLLYFGGLLLYCFFSSREFKLNTYQTFLTLEAIVKRTNYAWAYLCNSRGTEEAKIRPIAEDSISWIMNTQPNKNQNKAEFELILLKELILSDYTKIHSFFFENGFEKELPENRLKRTR